MFNEGYQCEWNIEYNPCDTTFFTCSTTGLDDYGMMATEDCVQDFFDPEFWGMMSQEEFWFQDVNQQYFDFYTYWNEYHMSTAGDDCDWKDIFATCNDFMILEGDCSIYVSYSPCDDTHFECEMSVEGPTGYEISLCNEDFENFDFWNQMKDEAYWTREENQHLNDFVQFWNAYHFGPQTDDGECAWKDIEIACSEFNFIEEECMINASYSPCNHDYFVCDMTKWGDYGMESEDCTEDFLDREFWQIMRNEPWWFEESSQEYFEFYEFWEAYHSANVECDEEPQMWDFECNVM